MGCVEREADGGFGSANTEEEADEGGFYEGENGVVKSVELSAVCFVGISIWGGEWGERKGTNLTYSWLARLYFWPRMISGMVILGMTFRW